MAASARPAILNPRAAALVILAGAAGLLWAGKLSPKPHAQAASAVPSQVGLWQGQVIPVDDKTVQILETDDVALMEYRLGEEPPVWFVQVAGFGNRAAFHPPELCYVGSHYEVLERGPITVHINGADRTLMRLVVSQGADRSEAWYWLTADRRVTPNYYQQQIWLMLDAVQQKPVSGTLVRISTPLEDTSKAHRRLLAFMTSYDSTVHAQGQKLARQ